MKAPQSGPNATGTEGTAFRGVRGSNGFKLVTQRTSHSPQPPQKKGLHGSTIGLGGFPKMVPGYVLHFGSFDLFSRTLKPIAEPISLKTFSALIN